MKHKITPEIRKQITKLCQDLPQVPFFIQGKNGMAPQRIANGKRISGYDVSPEDREKIGAEFSVKNDYVQRGASVRMMNHKVNLTSVFQNDGQDGIIAYTSYVNQLKQMIEGMRNKKHEHKAEYPLTESEMEPHAVSMQQEEHLVNQPETEITISTPKEQ